MGFLDAIKSCFNKYATFKGRATRSEYWWFVLLNFIMGFIPFVGYVWPLVVFIPTISVCVRRLHDTGRSGWWYWIAAIPLIGFIWLIVLMCLPSQEEENEYGPRPTF